MSEFFELLMNLDDYILQVAKDNLIYGYVLLFAIIFAESGSPIFSFLPGDGLLFTIGIISSTAVMSILIVIPMLIIAGFLGFYLNYFTGKYAGNKIIKGNFRIKEKHLDITNEFFKEHGRKALLICRFFPIVRSVAPFVAGMSKMDFNRFQKNSLLGATIWIMFFVGLGYLSGFIPLVRENFLLVFFLVKIIVVCFTIYGTMKLYFKKNLLS